MSYLIRNEVLTDQRRVEEITREAFWNIHVPGCDEHYLVHSMRDHKDFIKELDYVLLYNDEIIGNIMYTKSSLVGRNNERKEILTFGPVSILPEYQKKGFGSKLIEYSINEANKKQWEAIVIYGNPNNYVKYGFRSCKRYNVTNTIGEFPCALLVNELKQGVLKDAGWTFVESEAYSIDFTGFEEYEKGFPPRAKEETLTQEEFFILSNSRIG